MKSDPLAAFRRKNDASDLTGKKESETYVAFGGKDRVERLRIRRAMHPTRSPRYLHLQDMAYDGIFGTNFVLDFEFMLVLVRGKNLQGLVAALENSTVDFIQEYHPDLWGKPADDAPFIESIEVVKQGTGEESENVSEVNH